VSTTNLAQHLREAHGILYYNYKPLGNTFLALGLVFVLGYNILLVFVECFSRFFILGISVFNIGAYMLTILPALG
jgi:hypothetical protein